MLRKRLKDGSHADWEQVLEASCHAYRTSVNCSTNETPYYMLHGRDPVSLLEFALDVPLQEAVPSEDELTRRKKRLAYTYRFVREYLLEAQRQQKLQYDRRAQRNEYRVGDRVMLDVRTVPGHDSKKFRSYYEGFYRIQQLYSDNTVDIVNNSNVPKRVHVDRLRPLHDYDLWQQSQEDPFPLPPGPLDPFENAIPPDSPTRQENERTGNIVEPDHVETTGGSNQSLAATESATLNKGTVIEIPQPNGRYSLRPRNKLNPVNRYDDFVMYPRRK